MPLINIFESGLSLPARVCVLGPGPNGKEHYAKIPPDFYVIAAAKAVLIPDVRAEMWIMTHSHQDWYERASAGFKGIRVYSHEAAMRILPSLEDLERCYYFKADEVWLDPNVAVPVEGVIRYGATVTAVAAQIAYNFGAKEILLCGVDMSGDGYWDGTLNPERVHGDVWVATPKFNQMIKWLREQRGIKVFTVSPTKLDVEEYKPED